MTNKEKFKETFHEEPDTKTCPFEIDCRECRYSISCDMKYNCNPSFWDMEYDLLS